MGVTPPLRRSSVFVLCGLAALCLPAAVGGGGETAPPSSPGAGTFFVDRDDPEIRVDLRPSLGGLVRPGAWVPVRVGVTYAPADPADVLEATIELRPGHSGDPEYVRPLRMGAGRKELEVLLLPPEHQLELRVSCTIRDVDGPRETGRLLLPWQAPDAFAGAMVRRVAVVGAVPLPRFTHTLAPSAAGSVDLRLVVLNAPVKAEGLPLLAEGWQSADALLWYDADPAGLRPAQLEAIRAFVRRGGHLVLFAPIGRRPAWPGDLAPARFAGTAVLPLGTGEDGAPRLPPDLFPDGAREGLRLDAPLARTGGTGEAAGRLPVHRLADVRGRVLMAHGGRPLAVRRTVGAGRVTLVAIDPTHALLARTPARKDLLALALDLPLAPRHLPKSFREIRDYRSDTMRRGDITLVVSLFTDAASELQVVSVASIGLFCLAYVLVAGPGGYLLLRRAKRLPWVWGLLVAAALLFTAGAYAGARVLKGTRFFLRDVTILDCAPDGPARLRSWFGLYGSRPGRYVFRAEPSVTLTRSTFTAAGWNRHARIAIGVRANEDTAAPADRVETTERGPQPVAIPLRQWDFLRFRAEGTLGAACPLRAEVTRVVSGGRVRYRVAVENTGAEVLEEVRLYAWPRTLPVGRLEPGARVVLAEDGAASDGGGAARRVRGSPLRTYVAHRTVTMDHWPPPGVVEASGERRIRRFAPSLTLPAHDVLVRLGRAMPAETLFRGAGGTAAPGPGVLSPRTIGELEALALGLEAPTAVYETDLTGVLLDGGAVLTGWRAGSVGRFELEGRAVERTSATMLRLLVPPEAVRTVVQAPRADADAAGETE
jgi:hypothetical protein